MHLELILSDHFQSQYKQLIPFELRARIKIHLAKVHFAGGAQESEPHIESASIEHEINDIIEQDESELTTLFTDDHYKFIQSFEICLQESGFSLTADTSEQSVVSESDGLDQSLEMYALGNLPSIDDKNIPYDNMSGFRSFKISLTELFDKSIIGTLPSMLDDNDVQ